LDLGEKRIGLAVSDPEGRLTLPAGHLQRTKLVEDVRRVLEAAGERRVEGFLPVHETDERYTSVEAEALMREAGHQPSRDRAAVDEASAVLILQRFLDARTG